MKNTHQVERGKLKTSSASLLKFLTRYKIKQQDRSKDTKNNTVNKTGREKTKTRKN